MTPAFELPGIELLGRLDPAPVEYDGTCTIIEGVVSPKGQSSWPARIEVCDIHCFALAGWRLTGQPLIQRDLTVLRPVSPTIREGKQRADKIFEEIPAFSIQRLSVLLSKDRSRALVGKVLKIEAADESLLSLAERLRQPVVISTEEFGNLVLNPRIDWFEGKREWNGRSIDVRFDKCGDARIDNAMETASTLWKQQEVWKRRIEDFAVKELLALKNEDWLDEDEARLTPADFESRLELQSIGFAPDGSFDFCFDDGGLFCGHWIEIRGTLRDGPTDAEIFG